MQTIQIDGTFTYSSNIKTLKIGDQIKLISNPNNRINTDAIGAYTLSGKKIGYVPFKSNQIDLKAKYTVIKINLTQDNPLLLISREFDNSNFIQSESPFIQSIKYQDLTNFNNNNQDLKYFSNFLKKSGVNLTKIGITFSDQNFTNLLIETPDGVTIFYTVTKKYYEENVFKYDEFFKFNLIPKCIYQPFQIHRLEVYLEKNYKSINGLLGMKKLKWRNLLDLNIITENQLEDSNFGFEKIESANLILFNKFKINNSDLKLNYGITSIKKTINNNFIDNPDEYLELYGLHQNIDKFNSQNSYGINLDNLEYFKNIFSNIKPCTFGYNHEIKSYCPIDLYDDINIVEISDISTINKQKYIELLLKIVITNKQVINIYNPFKGIILRQEVPQLISNQIFNLIYKPKK